MEGFNHAFSLVSILCVLHIMAQRLEFHLDARKLCQHAGLAGSESDRLNCRIVQVYLIVAKSCKIIASFRLA